MFMRENHVRKQGCVLAACIMVSAIFVLPTQAQHLLSVGKKTLPDVKRKALLEHVRQQKGGLPPLGMTKESPPVVMLGGANRTAASLVLMNEKTGQSIVLSDISEVCKEVKLTPLILAELKTQGLGEADVFRCVLVDDVDAPMPVVRSAFTVSGDTSSVTMPVFRYGQKDNIRTTAIGERTLMGAIQMSPMYHPVDNLPETRAEIERLTQATKYDVYLYALPDGGIATYQPSLAPLAVVETLIVGDFTVDLTYSFSAEQKTAIVFTLQAWSDQLSASVPIRFELGFASLPGQTLAQAETSFWATGGKTYPASVYNNMEGYDADPSAPDFSITFNSNFSFSYVTTGSCPPGYTDFVSVFLHEVTHGLGFTAALNEDGSYLISENPCKWAEYLYYNGSTLNTLTDSGRYTAIRSTALYWDGPNAKAANSNSRIEMYAPSVYASGSSVSHWDIDVAFTTFMKYAIASGTYCRTINDREANLMKDIGWALSSEIGRRVIGVSGNLAFGSVANGSTATATLTITNTGSETLTISSITYPSGFRGNWPNGTIASGRSQNVTVSFTPNLVQAYGGMITVVSDATSGNNTISCSGSGSPRIMLNPSSLSVPEGGTATFNAKLSAQPTANTVVTVFRSAGDNDISVAGGMSLTFTTSNWNTYQTVTLAAAQDADTVRGSATITCSDGVASVNLIATEIEDDKTLTVIAGTGGTVSPSGATVVTSGAATSIHAISNAGYTFTNWTVTSGAATFANANATNTTTTISAPATIQANWTVTKTLRGTPYLWLDKYILVAGGDYAGAELTDTDQDGYMAWQEYVADTDPTNAASCFRIVAVSNLPPWRIYFEGSSTGRQYTTHWTTNLTPAVWTNDPSLPPVWGRGGIDSLTDTNTAAKAMFYRLKVTIP